MLERVDLNVTLSDDEYRHKLDALKEKLRLLSFAVYQHKRPVVIVFEGWDASGKGGAIKRLTSPLDPRGYVVWPISAPEGEDKKRHYLYRFWRRVPVAGQIAIFDRSWYGRVLVERVEGFSDELTWMRAYREINQFERQLADFGTIILKFWMHISQQEQLRRFKEREQTDYKRWKITDEDWRNRDKWNDYECAAEDMLMKTSTPYAPWTIVEADDKPFARVKVLETVVRKLEQTLK